MWWIYIAVPILIVFLCVLDILLRSLHYRMKKIEYKRTDSPSIPFDEESAILHLSAMIKCRTVSGEYSEFQKFRDLLPELYPLIYKNCSFEDVDNLALLFRWKGKDSSKAAVLMSHYDVVPADDQDWSYPPFDGIVAENKIYGRGSLDTKCTLCGILEAVETLLAQGFVPKQDVYLCFGGDEETDGIGAKKIAELLKSRNISPYLILDEGGAVVDGSVMGIKLPVALVGIAEKGYMNVEFVTKGQGGHTSLPTANPMTEMAKVIKIINSGVFKNTIVDPVKTMIRYSAAYADFPYRVFLANVSGLFRPFINSLAKKLPEVKALAATVGNITMIDGSNAPNVIPERVSAIGNFRILSGTDVDSTLGIIKKALRKLDVEINLIDGINPSKVSKIDGEGFELLAGAIGQTFGNAALIPYLMMASSDAHSYSDISDYIYRFSPFTLSADDRNSIHGIDESIAADNFCKLVEFFLNLLANM